jgi:hypothetical protein
MDTKTPSPRMQRTRPRKRPTLSDAEAQLGARVEDVRISSLMRAKNIDPAQPQLDFWPDGVRALPNDYARSALFTIRNKCRERETLHDAVVFHWDKNVTVTFTGIELRADDDQLVWLQILHYAKAQPLGMPVTFNLHSLCREIGWDVNGRNYARLRNCITRLKANSVRVDNARTSRGVGVSLIEKFSYDAKAYTVWIDRNLVLMFAGNSYAHLAWEPYRALPPIARKLFDYAATHRNPYPLPLPSFHQMCASTAPCDSSFRREARQACLVVQGPGLLKRAWLHTDDRIHLER